MTGRRSRAALAVPLLAVAAIVGAPRDTRAGDPSPADAPPAAARWEQQVEAETTEQDRLLDEARGRQAIGSVVTRYASRVSREGSAVNHFLLGRALYYNQDPVGAKAQMTAALEVDPRFWYAHLKLAQLLILIKSPAQAEPHLQAVLAAKPGNTDALKLSAEIAMDAKDWVRALRLLDELASRLPTDTRVRRNAAVVHMERKDWDAAIREWRLLRSQEPGDVGVRRGLAWALWQKGDLDGAAKEFEELARGDPSSVTALDMLRAVYVAKKDWPRVRETLERILPLLPPEKQKDVSEMIAVLRKGPPPDQPPDDAPRMTIDDVFRRVGDPDPEKRRTALQFLHEAAVAGYVRDGPWGTVLDRTRPVVETDWRCRAWAVKLTALVRPAGLFFLSVAVYDPVREIRSLAIEGIGDIGRPAGIAYLLPLLQVEDASELNAVRAALTKLTGYRDFPPDVAVATSESMAAVRESWRRWRLSDESRAAKIEAIRDVMLLGEVVPERYLFQFVQDDTFDVMREAYATLRDATTKPPADPVQRKTFPRFPRFADAEVTRANMKTIQDRVLEWWGDWVAERRALLRAREPEPSEAGMNSAGPK